MASWAKENVDPALFPREFLANASDLVGNDDEVVSSKNLTACMVYEFLRSWTIERV